MIKKKIAIVMNIIPEVPSKHLGIEASPMGGWLMSMVERLNEYEDLKLDIISPYTGKKIIKIQEESINYILIPSKNNGTFWNDYISKYNPDIIHVNGTEMLFTRELFKINFGGKIIVSLQGIIHEISKYIYGNLTTREILLNTTIKDLIRGTTLPQIKRNFSIRAQNEEFLLDKADVIIGRTDWDRGYIRSLGLENNYYHCNENLRENFYNKHLWDFEKCTKYTIFCSQGAVPYKGLHVLLKSIPIVKKMYPQIKIRISGYNPLNQSNLLSSSKRSTYGNYLIKLIKKLDLEKNIEFIGLLDENRMIEEYLSANIFVQSSLIENSPNSLGEAMMLGVPCIASDVGGTSNFIKHKYNGLIYDSKDSMILAKYITDMFNSPEDASRLAFEGRKTATSIFNRDLNSRRLYQIYLDIFQKGE